MAQLIAYVSVNLGQDAHDANLWAWVLGFQNYIAPSVVLLAVAAGLEMLLRVSERLSLGNADEADLAQ